VVSPTVVLRRSFAGELSTPLADEIPLIKPNFTPGVLSVFSERGPSLASTRIAISFLSTPICFPSKGYSFFYPYLTLDHPRSPPPSFPPPSLLPPSYPPPLSHKPSLPTPLAPSLHPPPSLHPLPHSSHFHIPLQSPPPPPSYLPPPTNSYLHIPLPFSPSFRPSPTLHPYLSLSSFFPNHPHSYCTPFTLDSPSPPPLLPPYLLNPLITYRSPLSNFSR